MNDTNPHQIDPHSLTPEGARRMLNISESFLAYLAGATRKRLLDIRRKVAAGKPLTPAEWDTAEKIAPYANLLPRLCQSLRNDPNAVLAPEDQELLERMWDLLAAHTDACACTGLFAFFLVQQGGCDWISSESVAPIRMLNQRFNRLLSPADWVTRLTRASEKPQERQVMPPAFFWWGIPRKIPPMRLKDAGDHQMLHQPHPGRHQHATAALISPLVIGRYPRLWPSDLVYGQNGLLPSIMGIQPSGLGPPAGGAWDRQEYQEWCDYREEVALQRRLRMGRTPETLKPHRVSWAWDLPDQAA